MKNTNYSKADSRIITVPEFLSTDKMDEHIKVSYLKRYRWIFITVAALLFIGIMAFVYLNNSQTTLSVFESALVERGDVATYIILKGDVINENPVYINSLISGIVRNIFVHEGDNVTSGQVLCEIETSTYEMQIEETENKIKINTASLNGQQFELASKELEYKYQEDKKNSELAAQKDRLIVQKELYEINAISRKDVLDLEKQIADLEKELNYLKRQFELVQKIYEQNMQVIKLNIEEDTRTVNKMKQEMAGRFLKSDSNGIIQKIDIRRNDYITKDTLCFTILKDNDFQLVCKIPISYIENIKEGQTAEIIYNNRKFYGKINKISSIVQSDDYKEDYILGYITLNKNSEFSLLVGMKFDVKVIKEIKKNVLRIVRGDFIAESGFQYVFKIEDNTAKKTDIKTGAYNDDYIEIISGLNEGDLIITSSYNAYHMFNSVKIKERN